MQIILLKDVEKLGKAGISLEVKDGYAHNYLLPKKLALVASERNIKKFQEQEVKNQARKEKELDKLRQSADKLSGKSFTVVSKAIDEKKLYGSVDKEEIKKSMESEGLALDLKNIVLDEPIKELGVYDITIRFHPEIETLIKVWVVKK